MGWGWADPKDLTIYFHRGGGGGTCVCGGRDVCVWWERRVCVVGETCVWWERRVCVVGGGRIPRSLQFIFTIILTVASGVITI